MRDRVPCEFFLIRYVPDVVKGEFTNIGVVLREAEASIGRAGAGEDRIDAAAGRSIVRFTRDWSRVRCMDANADTALFEALETEISGRLEAAAGPGKPLLETLEDSLSNSLQISAPRATLAESLPAEMDQLMRLYVEPIRIKAEGVRRRSGRAAIVASMRTEFERAGVWALMRKRIAASLYTAPGDPMKLDCGYRPNGVIRIFQAVSLDGDVEAAKVLAYTAPLLREGVSRVEGATLDLTAVVEPLRSLKDEAEESELAETYRFGVETMERQAIRVMTVNDLARMAETARTELRL